MRRKNQGFGLPFNLALWEGRVSCVAFLAYRYRRTDVCSYTIADLMAVKRDVAKCQYRTFRSLMNDEKHGAAPGRASDGRKVR